MVELEDNYSGEYVPIKTNWFDRTVPQMWHYVNQQLEQHYNQAQGWKMATELTGLYRSRLETYKESFANEWRNSPAQELFMAELDKLILSVKNSTDIASANYTAAVDIPGAIFEAKMKLEPIYNAFKAASTDLSSCEGDTEPDDIKALNKTMDDKKYEAAPIMYELSRQIVKAQQAMIQPAPYVGPGRVDGQGNDYGSPNLPPAMIPPVLPVPPPPAAPTPTPTAPLPTPTAPDLSSLQPTQTRPPMPTLPTPPITPTPTTPGLIGPLPPTLPTAVGPPRPTLGLPGMPGVPGPTTAAGNPRSALPPGGMIGQQPGAPGAPGARGAGAKPLPPGGMINGAGGGAGRPGMGAPGGPGAPGRGGPLGGAPGRPGAPGQHDEDGEHFDPDTQWHVAHGVAPVVVADDAPGTINPGPAIGLDR
ncbi:hypothetical protein [Catelliglobosispora koreensis]|uniref:hypothetical protein n=1 Tax=Catelliglobosispora koreensis TaxID=129052 RepID=UPI00039D2907|nr:hypothetical protein [Catelliglobosispora koreensis]